MSTRRSTVKARTNQIESAIAAAEYKKQHIYTEEPKQPGKSKQKPKSRPESDEESGDEMELVELVRALTIGEIGPAGSHNELNALREAFKILDCDEDGFITLPDLREAMKSFEEEEEEDQTTDEELLEMITEADEEGNGRINFESFVRMLEPTKKEKKKRLSTSTSSSQKSS